MTFSLGYTDGCRLYLPVNRMLAQGIQLGMNGFYTERDIDEPAAGILKVFDAYAR